MPCARRAVAGAIASNAVASNAVVAGEERNLLDLQTGTRKSTPARGQRGGERRNRRK
jgi:hypothetical protein